MVDNLLKWQKLTEHRPHNQNVWNTHAHWPCDRKSPDSLRFICDPVIERDSQSEKPYDRPGALTQDGIQRWNSYSRTKQASTTRSMWCLKQCANPPHTGMHFHKACRYNPSPCFWWSVCVLLQIPIRCSDNMEYSMSFIPPTTIQNDTFSKGKFKMKTKQNV